MSQDRKRWGRKSHEAGVEVFYGTGAQNFGEYHGGYLNFGYWTEGIENYLQAAENLVRTMGERIGLDKDSRLLDVACGLGPQDVFMAKEFGCSIDAVDVTWPHVEAARRRAEICGVGDRVCIHHGSATELPFPDQSFSHAMCVEGAEHFNTREQFLKEARRVLKPGGRIILADYLLTEWPKTRTGKLLIDATAKLWHVPKANYETIETFGKTMERCGFKDVKLELIGAQTIPGYYFEARKPENLKEQSEIRGWLRTKLSWFVDYSVYRAHRDGLVEYVLATASV